MEIFNILAWYDFIWSKPPEDPYGQTLSFNKCPYCIKGPTKKQCLYTKTQKDKCKEAYDDKQFISIILWQWKVLYFLVYFWLYLDTFITALLQFSV